METLDNINEMIMKAKTTDKYKNELMERIKMLACNGYTKDTHIEELRAKNVSEVYIKECANTWDSLK